MRLPEGRTGRFRGWRRAAGLALAGALPMLAFPAPSLWWFAYVALVPWMLLVRSAPTARQAARDGWAGGFGFMVAVHHWLLPSLNVFLFVLAALLGALWAPWGLLVHRFLGPRTGPGGAGAPGAPPSARRLAAALLVVPCGWLLPELVRSWQGLGGPWGLLGATQWQVEPALRLASVGGVWLLSLLVAAVNVAVAVLLLTLAPARRPWHPPVPGRTGIAPSGTSAGAVAGGAVVALAGLVLVTLAVSAAWVWAPRPQVDGRVRIALVQAGVVSGEDSPERRFAREESLTRRLAGQDVDLVVWGESSVGFDLDDRPDLARRIAALSRLLDADVLVNVDARRADRPGIYKSAILVGAEGPTGDRYDKMRLVPFGEYIPARSLLGWATSVGKAAGEDRRRGEEQVVMDAGHGLRLGPLVCFETAFPDMSRHLAADGAELLLAQSSTSSFQHSWAPEQHASLAALRAAETGRPVVHATLTGVSAVHGPDGARLGSWLGTGDAGTSAVFEVPLAHGTTPYVRHGDWPVHAALLVLAALCVTEGARALRAHGRVQEAADRSRTAMTTRSHSS
ncbi:apolipoprotein N-acyltransferase [Streptomyces griseoaurantiacus M045]|uniref:Apolipoprotein N-acyltransferase n=1 Tax=Streptomyces griseoaurantiacus M045 TaxID=996637 RepID=F3NTG6_9ACTN|nr:apolipoprotein N-acyltransferase [Streptomyces griseoaurantiacus M045]